MLAVLFLLLLLQALLLAAELSSSDPKYGRQADRTAYWQQVGGDLIWGFNNMYHLFILREPEDAAYPYKGWFFGWASTPGNTNYGFETGCDMTFAARAPRLEGPWEVYCGDDKWDTTMNPALWRPVLRAQNEPFDSWHNGDSSLVKLEGRYYMAYSSTGFNQDMIPFGHPGDTDSDLCCVMGAVSEDGLVWQRSQRPILLDERNIGQAPRAPGEFMHPVGLFHRPSLMRDGEVWRCWFDCFTGTDMPMAYAENRGDFLNSADWKVLNGPDNPLFSNFPNPDVVRIEDVYFAFADPGGYAPLLPEEAELAAKMDKGWASRKVCELVSLDGLDWLPLGYIERDADAQANQVPVAYVESAGGGTYWLYLSYATQVWGSYEQDKIRLKRRLITPELLAEYRELLLGASQ